MSMNATQTNLYRISIPLPYGKLQETIDWCIRNCEATWQFDPFFPGYEFNSDNTEFLFESEKDYIAFLLWKK